MNSHESKEGETKNKKEIWNIDIFEGLEIVDNRELEGGQSTSRSLTFDNGLRAAFKPASGETSFRHFTKKGDQYKKERAAYVVSEILGFGFVPPTFIHTVNGEIGSLQFFVEEAIEISSSSELEGNPKIKNKLAELNLFDYIIWNSDRHWGNFLHKDEGIIAIDHGYSFSPDEIRVANKFFDVPMDQVATKLASVDPKYVFPKIVAALRDVLPREQIKACLWRIHKAMTTFAHEDYSLEALTYAHDTDFSLRDAHYTDPDLINSDDGRGVEDWGDEIDSYFDNESDDGYNDNGGISR